MLRCFISKTDHINQVDLDTLDATATTVVPTPSSDTSTLGSELESRKSKPPKVVWYDLWSPDADEVRTVEKALNTTIPTKDKMKEIEASSRLYQADGVTYMTITLLSNDGDELVKSQMTFILKGEVLVTVRYANPLSINAFTARAQRANRVSFSTGEHVMLGIIESVIDSTADTLENLSDEIDTANREVFGKKSSNATKNASFLQSLIERIGAKAADLSAIRESLVTISRLVTYQTANLPSSAFVHKEAKQRLKVIQRDAISLSEHASFQSGKITFLLDSTLGQINLEQNQIIKIFSVAAVVFLPPTLVASVYGMNFDDMPELHWHFGYPYALGLMVLLAVLPLYFFKKRGWL